MKVILILLLNMSHQKKYSYIALLLLMMNKVYRQFFEQTELIEIVVFPETYKLDNPVIKKQGLTFFSRN